MTSSRTIFACAFFLLALAAVLPAFSQELDVYVSADTVTVGERFRVSVSARHDFASPPEFPDPMEGDSLVFGDVEVIRRLSRQSSIRDGMQTDSVVYEVATFALDTARVPPIPVLFTAGEDTFTVHTEATMVPVASLVPPDAGDVRDLAPLVEFPVSAWSYVLAAAALLLLALIAFYLWRRRRQQPDSAPPPPEPPIPPDIEAFQRLKALEEADLTRRDAVKPYYVELSDTLRTYVSRKLDVHALERTTKELVSELQTRRVPNEETTSRIRNILVQSDYVKFADAEPPPQQSRSLLGTARSVIESIEDQTRPELEPSDGVVIDYPERGETASAREARPHSNPEKRPRST